MAAFSSAGHISKFLAGHTRQFFCSLFLCYVWQNNSISFILCT